MRCAWIGLAGVLLVGVPTASAQSWFAAGVQWSQIQEAGVGGNTFLDIGENQGYMIEIGARGRNSRWATVFEWDWYKTVNTVGVSTVDVTFVVPASIEARLFFVKKGYVLPFFGFGAAWSRMKVAGMQGADNQVLLPLSVGVQVHVLRGHLLAQPVVRYYGVAWNSLGQTSGVQGAFLLGTTW